MGYGFDFNKEKNEELKKSRNISFEEIIFHIPNGKLLDIIKHPNKEKYGDQKLLVVNVENYAFIVPFIKQNENTLFLKTIFPSRRMTKKYLNQKGDQDETK